MELLVSRQVKLSTKLDVARTLSKPLYQFVLPPAPKSSCSYHTGSSGVLTSPGLMGVKWHLILFSLHFLEVELLRVCTHLYFLISELPVHTLCPFFYLVVLFSY